MYPPPHPKLRQLEASGKSTFLTRQACFCWIALQHCITNGQWWEIEREHSILSPMTCNARHTQNRFVWQLSLRDVSKELAARGFLNELGKPYAAKSVASMMR